MFGRATDIIRLQRRDHERMEQLLRRYENGNVQTKQRAYAQIVELVTKHAFAEETVLFPAARRLLAARGDVTTGEIEQKHQNVNELMVHMEAGEPGEATFDAQAVELFAQLRSDARQEEDELLAELANKSDPAQLRAIGATWAVARLTAPNRPHPRVSRRPPGNLLAGLPLALSDRLRKRFARRERGIA